MIDFSERTYQNILRKQLDRVPDSLDKREGSVIQTALGPESWYLEGVYLDLDRVQKNAHAETAGGEALDLICAERGIRRKQAVKAVKKGIFNVPVPEGSRFSAVGNPGLTYRTVEMLEENEGAYVYGMECETAGSAGGGYTGALLAVDYVTGLTSAALGELLVPGSEEEGDEKFRERYMATFDVPSFGGNVAAYRREILGIEGVGAVQVYPAWQGGGTVLCSIVGTDMRPAPEGLVAKVQQMICPPEEGGEEPSADGYGFAPIGALVTVVSASALEVDVSCTIQTEAQVGPDALRESIRGKINSYLEEVCAGWGRERSVRSSKYTAAVYLSRIIQTLMSVEGVVNVTDVQINGKAEDIYCVQNAQLQQVPVLGEVLVNGN